MAELGTTTWTKEWPKEPGNYWFYGVWRPVNRKASVRRVVAMQFGDNSITFCAEDNVMWDWLYKREVEGECWWAFRDEPFPDPPKEI